MTNVKSVDRATAAYYAKGLEFPEGTIERVEWLYRKSEHKPFDEPINEKERK